MRVNLDGSFLLNQYEHNIIAKLYKFRLLTNEQLMYLIHPELITDTYPINPKNDPQWRKQYSSKYSRIRKELINLTEHKFLQSKPFKLTTGRQSTMLYGLHPDKLEIVKGYLDIPLNYYGSGWNNDLGDLPEDLFAFPKRIEHHLDSINFYIKLTYAKQLFSFKNEIDYIDNIYTARTYPTAYTDKMKLKPDGELKIFAYHNDELIAKPGLHAWVEIDRSTESGSILKTKFENYNGYLQYIKSLSDTAKKEHSTELPSVILSITNASTGLSRRWGTFINAYESQMQEHYSHFNMIVCNLQNIHEVIESYANKFSLTKRMAAGIESIAEMNLGFKGQKHLGYVKENITDLQQQVYEKLKWLPQFTITENEPTRKQLYLYLKLDCYETQGICRYLEFIRKQSTLPAPLQTIEVIPVFYQMSGTPIAIPVLESLNEKEAKALALALTYVVNDNEWYSDDNIPLSKQTSIHPLVYRLHHSND